MIYINLILVFCILKINNYDIPSYGNQVKLLDYERILHKKYKFNI